MEKNGVEIGGQFFPKRTFEYLMIRFKESFSHASLSVEQAFGQLEDYTTRLNMIHNDYAYEYYKMLDSKERKKIDADLRRFIVYYGDRYGLLFDYYDQNEQLRFNVNSPQGIVDKIFGDNFKYMAKDMHYVLKFDEEGHFLQRETFANIGEMFDLAFQKNAASETAYNMQKDHMDAFDYAMSLDHIGIREIIDINEKVNHTCPNKEVGFKHTNNSIIGANFKVADKTAVPTEMQRLLSEYNNNFGLEIKDIDDPTLTHNERAERILKLFEKEAIFHIRFERIHPFADGNGRTGRIIMNKHLLENGMAPVLITGVMTDEYKKYINNFDYEGLAKMMLSSSSQLLSNWMSMRKAGISHGTKGETNKELAKVSNGQFYF